jgi:hypothetical protein
MNAATAARLKEAVSLAAASFATAIPVAWMNRDYTPDGERFIQADIIPAPAERLTVGGRHRNAGSLVLTLASKSNIGTGQALGIADAIAAAFPCDLRLTGTDDKTIRITAQPSIRQGFIDKGFWRTPITIPFEVL